MSLRDKQLLDLSVSDHGSELVVRATADLSDLTPVARQQIVELRGLEHTYELFRKGAPLVAARLRYRQRPGQQLEVRLAGQQYERPLLERLSRRVAEVLPRWVTLSDNDALLSLLEPDLAVGHALPDGSYGCQAILHGHAKHHKAQLLLVGRYLAFRHDPERTLRFRRSRKSELAITPDTPWQHFLSGHAGQMTPRADYDPSTCRELVPLRDAERALVLHWSGPDYHLQVRAAREQAVALALDTLEAWSATLAASDRELERRFGFGDLRRLMGL